MKRCFPIFLAALLLLSACVTGKTLEKEKNEVEEQPSLTPVPPVVMGMVIESEDAAPEDELQVLVKDGEAYDFKNGDTPEKVVDEVVPALVIPEEAEEGVEEVASEMEASSVLTEFTASPESAGNETLPSLLSMRLSPSVSALAIGGTVLILLFIGIALRLSRKGREERREALPDVSTELARKEGESDIDYLLRLLEK